MTQVSTGDPLAGAILLLVVIGVYFFPFIIALIRRQPNNIAIFLINLFFGWSVIGWFVALIWAVKAKEQPLVVYADAVAPPGPDRKPSLSCTVPDALYQAVAALAESRGTTLSDICRRAIIEYLERQIPPSPADDPPADTAT